jgi:hypothetical protein
VQVPAAADAPALATQEPLCIVPETPFVEQVVPLEPLLLPQPTARTPAIIKSENTFIMFFISTPSI